MSDIATSHKKARRYDLFDGDNDDCSVGTNNLITVDKLETIAPKKETTPKMEKNPKKTPDSADIDIEEPQGEEKVEATGLIDSSSENDEATPKDIERDECKIWDLPVSLAGNIVSYKTSTTAEVAKVSVYINFHYLP